MMRMRCTHFWLIVMMVSGSLSGACAQVSYRGDVSLQIATGWQHLEVPIDESSTQWLTSASVNYRLSGHLEANSTWEDLDFFLALDPSLSFTSVGSSFEGQWGLSELYTRYSLGDVDIALGLERLPLEAARLNVPFSLASPQAVGSGQDPKGSFEGLWGARATWYPGDNRLRLALVYLEEQRFAAVASAKRYFGDFELEAHAIYQNTAANSVVLGLTGSSLFADMVLYGEAWLLFEEGIGSNVGYRALLGATGYFGYLTWTLEGGHFPSSGLEDAFPQALAHLALAPDDDGGAWSFGTGAALLEEDLVLQLSASYLRQVDGASSGLAFYLQAMEGMYVLGASWSITGRF